MSLQSSGYVYFIHAPAVNLVKIGFTAAVPDRRLRALRCGSPVRLKRLGLLRGPRQLEKSLHARFREHHSHGEWFHLSGDLALFAETETRRWERPAPSKRAKSYEGMLSAPDELSPAGVKEAEACPPMPDVPRRVVRRGGRVFRVKPRSEWRPEFRDPDDIRRKAGPNSHPLSSQSEILADPYLARNLVWYRATREGFTDPESGLIRRWLVSEVAAVWRVSERTVRYGVLQAKKTLAAGRKAVRDGSCH
jgi:hypothetical protein